MSVNLAIHAGPICIDNICTSNNMRMYPYDAFVCICIYIQTYKQNVHIVGDKAKVRISKWRKQENKARQVSEKRAFFTLRYA